jgi:hypothetical protein
MMTRTLVSILILVSVVLIVSDGFAKRKKAIPIEDAMKQFEGAYVNTEYSGKATKSQKIVITSDGRVEDWPLAGFEKPAVTGEYAVAERCVDSKGNMYCTVDEKWPKGSPLKALWKLDKSGSTLEMNFRFGSGGEYPTEIDPNASGIIDYWIGYRQKNVLLYPASALHLERLL